MKRRAIWILLIDVSDSMDAGFSGKKETQGLIETGGWRTKLEAAKEILMRQVSNLPRTVDVAIISFSEDSRLEYIGPSGDVTTIANVVGSLHTRGRTNLASAFYEAISVAQRNFYQSVSVVVVSDGLSNEGDPVVAAEKFIDGTPGSRISSILIDRTDEGKKIVDGVSIHGDVRFAETYLDLSTHLSEEQSNALAYALHSLELERSSIEQSLAISRQLAPPQILEFKGTDQVHFSSGFVGRHVLPYLESIESIQKVSDKILEKRSYVKFHSITHYSPVKASVSGVKDAIFIIEKWITPWKREHEKRIARLKEDEEFLNNRKRDIEYREIEARSEKESAEARKMRAEAEELEIENDRKRFKFKCEQARLAIDLISELKKNNIEISHAEVAAYVSELIEPLKSLIESPIDLVVIKNEKEN